MPRHYAIDTAADCPSSRNVEKRQEGPRQWEHPEKGTERIESGGDPSVRGDEMNLAEAVVTPEERVTSLYVQPVAGDIQQPDVAATIQ
jgi:hypothetical protein